MSSFDSIADPVRRRETQLFIGGMIVGTNISSVILRGLVAKGVFRKEEVEALLDDAEDACRNIELPAGYGATVTQLFESMKKGY